MPDRAAAGIPDATPVLNVLLIGQAAGEEFAEPLQWLARHTRMHREADVNEAAHYLASHPTAPHWIVLLQARPGTFTPDDVQRLARLAPLARLSALVGTYCEGQQRSGRPLPGVQRIYWHQWIARCEGQLAMWRQGRAGAWALPRTASAVERELFAGRRRLPSRAGLAAVRSRLLLDFEGLADVCLRVGLSPVWVSHHRPLQLKRADLLIWDSDGREAFETESLRALHSSLQPAATLVLRGFPRREEVHQLRSAGADRVLAKPLMLEDLMACFERLLPAASQVVASTWVCLLLGLAGLLASGQAASGQQPDQAPADI
ncbi:MAG: hypothetical protein J5I93_06415, partial [Pirellulaceae bacterium]|nr:hypothetical protein [Pirellulaceae bacterium]